MQEMLPIASGLLLGGLLAANRLPVYVRVLLVLTLAACATIASGESRVSWDFSSPMWRKLQRPAQRLSSA
jgi:hypothetical protein